MKHDRAIHDRSELHRVAETGMRVEARPTEAETDHRTTWSGTALWAGAAACLVAAGLLLWAVRGGAVFSDMVLSALAWCF
jgi:hypothetical protein